MFAFIRGKIAAKSSDSAIIDANGIGYRVMTSYKTLMSMGEVGCESQLFTYLHIREDAVVLFGFYTQEEVSVFELLISVSGVGPKAALSLLSAHTPSKLSLAIVTGDYKLLREAPGIGLKLAQRMVLELKDKILKDSKDSDLKNIALAVDDTPLAEGQASAASEAVSALTVLGYSQSDAGRIVSKVFKDGMSTEEIIKEALKASAGL